MRLSHRKSREESIYDVLWLHRWHIRGFENEWALIEQELYSAKTIFLTQISILAAIPAIALYVGVTQVRWSVAGEKPVRPAESSALGSALLFYFAM